MAEVKKKNHVHKLGKEARSALISCSDYRFWPAAIKFIKEQYNPVMMDLETHFGGPEKLAIGSESSHVLLNEVAMSGIFHQINEVFLVSHQDCDAYGGSIAFESPEVEEELIRKDLVKGAEVIAQKYPKVKIIKLFAYFDGDDVKLKEV